MTTTDVRLWTVDEYYRMAAAGIITPDERVELIEGQVIPMSPKNPPHAATNLSAADVFRKLLSGKALIRIQDPVSLSLYSELEPDIAVVSIDSQLYRDRHPIPDDIFLLVEVADTTLNRDTQQKAQIYAKAKIADYWVLDVNSRQVYMFREPLDNRYTQQIILDENGTISLVAFGEVEVKVEELFA
jgi:Uma2 family endonuclease